MGLLRGLYCFFIHFFTIFRHIYTQIQIESRWCWQFVELAGTRSWDLEVVVVFPHISASRCCRFSAVFVYFIALGQLHCCTGNADPHMLANPLGSHT